MEEIDKKMSGMMKRQRMSGYTKITFITVRIMCQALQVLDEDNHHPKIDRLLEMTVGGKGGGNSGIREVGERDEEMKEVCQYKANGRVVDIRFMKSMNDVKKVKEGEYLEIRWNNRNEDEDEMVGRERCQNEGDREKSVENTTRNIVFVKTYVDHGNRNYEEELIKYKNNMYDAQLPNMHYRRRNGNERSRREEEDKQHRRRIFIGMDT